MWVLDIRTLVRKHFIHWAISLTPQRHILVVIHVIVRVVTFCFPVEQYSFRTQFVYLFFYGSYLFCFQFGAMS